MKFRDILNECIKVQRIAHESGISLGQLAETEIIEQDIAGKTKYLEFKPLNLVKGEGPNQFFIISGGIYKVNNQEKNKENG